MKGDEIMIILQIIEHLLTGIGIGLVSILNLFPIVNELSNVKETIAVAFLGVPAVVASIVTFVYRLTKKDR